MTASCTGWDRHAGEMFNPLGNPNSPDAQSEVARRVRGEVVSTTPILPEEGDIWPGQPDPVPSLQDVSRSNSHFIDKWHQLRPQLEADLQHQLADGQGITVGEGVGKRYGSGKVVMPLDKTLPSHVQDNASAYLEPLDEQEAAQSAKALKSVNHTVSAASPATIPPQQEGHKENVVAQAPLPPPALIVVPPLPQAEPVKRPSLVPQKEVAAQATPAPQPPAKTMPFASALPVSRQHEAVIPHREEVAVRKATLPPPALIVIPPLPPAAPVKRPSMVPQKEMAAQAVPAPQQPVKTMPFASALPVSSPHEAAITHREEVATHEATLPPLPSIVVPSAPEPVAEKEVPRQDRKPTVAPPPARSGRYNNDVAAVFAAGGGALPLHESNKNTVINGLSHNPPAVSVIPEEMYSSTPSVGQGNDFDEGVGGAKSSSIPRHHEQVAASAEAIAPGTVSIPNGDGTFTLIRPDGNIKVVHEVRGASLQESAKQPARYERDSTVMQRPIPMPHYRPAAGPQQASRYDWEGDVIKLSETVGVAMPHATSGRRHPSHKHAGMGGKKGSARHHVVHDHYDSLDDFGDK
ncbi:hypothetical protein [Bombella saccharophila]|uniref:Uncharacterized protein n=1 Tax=Bombella saccharophila TaxID=2967338 RepID=A0ABT3W6M1_9PROT|nr:hypothetical protein [Bombella saccharophila]MCX5614029.1 hypothetical protein [Bombella saccharophila]